jgi:hypothetical protein
MEFRVKALTFRGRPDLIPLRVVWDIETAELSPNGSAVRHALAEARALDDKHAVPAKTKNAFEMNSMGNCL